MKNKRLMLIVLMSMLLFVNASKVYADRFSLVHDKRSRRYDVYTPSGYNQSASFPVVIYFHGAGGNINACYKKRLNRMSDKFGFILVSPEGTGMVKTWNGGEWDGDKCCGYAMRKNIDDVGFIQKVIAEVEENFKVDEKRIYLTGFSNGALMVYRLACELSDKIAAIAVVAPLAVPSPCEISEAIPVMHIHGTADPRVPFAGGKGEGGRFDAQSAREMVDSWIQRDQCSEDFTTSYQKGDATCVSYGGCSEDAKVVFCTIVGMGHTWPSGKQYLPEETIGAVSFDISFDQMWEFLSSHSKN